MSNNQRSSSFLAIRFFLAAVMAVVFVSVTTVGTVASDQSGRGADRKSDALSSPSISITTLGVPITQNFDTLASIASDTNPWTDDVTLVGWYSQFSLQVTNPTVYRSNSGTQNSGAIYSWGVLGANALEERALGTIGSGTPGDIFIAIKLTNNTGSTINAFDISYVGEQWRQGGCTPAGCTPLAQTVDFQYQVAAPGIITDANSPTTGWLDSDALDFVTPVPGVEAAAAVDGNLAANRTAKSATVTVDVANGQEIWLRWRDINHANNDHGHAIDDFSVTPRASTAAGVFAAGRVTTAEGRGITNAMVTISGNSLPEPRTVITGRRGTYIFDDLEPGETYILTVRARRFTFSNPSQVISIVDNVSDADFIADGGTSRGR